MREYGVYKGMQYSVTCKNSYRPHPRKDPQLVKCWYWILVYVLGDNNHQGKRVPIRLNDEECIELQGPAIPDAFKNFENPHDIRLHSELWPKRKFVEIPDEEKPSLIQFYEDKIQVLEKKIAEYNGLLALLQKS